MIIAIIEAGLARRRPSEMLMAPVAGEPMISCIIRRVRQARTLTRVICAVSQETADDGLTGYLTGQGISVFRGDPADPLTGYVRCVRASGAGHAVCLAAETPLIDPGLVDEAVRYALASRSDLVTNRLYPQGLDVAVATDMAFMHADRLATGYERSLAPTSFMASRPDCLQTASFNAPRDWSDRDWRADTPEGFALARSAFETLHPENDGFGVDDILYHLGTTLEAGRGQDVQVA